MQNRSVAYIEYEKPIVAISYSTLQLIFMKESLIKFFVLNETATMILQSY